MNKSKKVLSSILAVLMLVSMLACFSLPVTAAASKEDCYYVSTANEWNAVANEINNDAANGEGKTIHILCDIDWYKGKDSNGNKTYYSLTRISKFHGTLDGHGHKFTNINATANTQDGKSLFYHLYGTVQNLTLDSTCVFTNNYNESSTNGAFAVGSVGGIFLNCASYATYIAKEGSSCIGGFAGLVRGITIEGCIFGGTITGNGTSSRAGAFFGDTNSPSIYPVNINYSVANGTITASNATADAAYIRGTSYAIGAYGNAQTMSDVKEAVWLINESRKAIEPNEDERIFMSVDVKGTPCFGNKNDRVVRMENTETGVYTYHAPRTTKTVDEKDYSAQTEIEPETVSGKVPVVTGAEYNNGKIYVGHNDITLEYQLEIEQKRAELEAMITAYEKMAPKYFTDMKSMQSWVSGAEANLNSASLSDLQGQIDAEANIVYSLATMSKLTDYPSVRDYNTYKYVESIKDYKVETAEDWLAAVDMSNYVENPNAVNFSGVTLHLTNHINMDGAKMLPLCYGWIFDGNLDGHDKVFRNINIKVDSSYGPVGLIGVLGETEARTVQNVGIESGSIKVTGWPRNKIDLIMERLGNYAAGIVGKNYYEKSFIRKCWNNANFNVENIDDSDVAGIVADPSKSAVVDSCFNLGQTGDLGIMGHGLRAAIACNSFSGAGTNAVSYRANIATNTNFDPDALMINICGIRSTLELTNFTKVDTTASEEDQKRQQKAMEDQHTFQETFNKNNTEFSNAAAAWKVNANYAQQEYGNKERIYYTLTKDGDVRFGAPDGSDQIYRIELVCDQNCDGDGNAQCATHSNRYAYGVAGRDIALNFDIEANYYACENEKVAIKGNTLRFEEDIQIAGEKEDKMTIIVYVGYNADRGDVKTDDDINVLDVLSVVQMVARNKPEDLLTADVDSNHAVDINDAYQIIRYVFKMKGANATPFEYKADKKSDYLKVLSYNIKGALYDSIVDGGNGTALSRLTPVVEEIKAIDADIMGIQENIFDNFDKTDDPETKIHVLQKIYEKLEEETGETYYWDYIMTRVTGANEGGNGIISKYPILNSKTVYFADEVRLDGDVSKRLDDTTGSPRAFTWYKIDVDGGGFTSLEEDPNSQDIIFYNAHLATNTVAGTSAEQLKFILDYMKKNHANERVVCTADFNLAAYKMIDIVANANASDTGEANFKITALNGGERFNSYISTNAYSGSMIDNILVNQNVEYFHSAETKQTTACGLSNSITLYNAAGEVDDVNGWSASDHLPVWAYIKLKPSA